MSRYAMLKKGFEFLAKDFNFRIQLKQKSGAYYYIIWTNSKTNIMVLYDEQVNNPLSIRIYASDSFSFDAVEYKNEFEQQSGTPQSRIYYAACWLKKAIENGAIRI